MPTSDSTRSHVLLEVKPSHVSLKQAFWYWLKLGFISFGGPAGQIAVMHHDLVEKKLWISDQRFLHALNYCMLLPGPEAQQLAIYIGWLLHRTWGGVVAGVLFVLPSFFILVLLAWLYMLYGEVSLISDALYGIKPAVVAIVLFAAYRIGLRILKNTVLWGIACFALIAIFMMKLPFPWIVLMAAIIGVVGGKVMPHYFALGNTHASAYKKNGLALIDDDTPPPEHAIFSWKKLIRVGVVGILLWLLGMLCLTLQFGWDAVITQMGWFFTKAALLTFGGAYAVLPYVYQGAVEQYQWLTASQMMDGLALGETTPGPLIMVVTFVGFVGGWLAPIWTNDTVFVSALFAAGVVTYFTFLPSFIFIFLGAPLIESTHQNLKFTAPLTAITAAVVGVIVNLALFFAYHVYWKHGFSGPFDLLSFAITLLAIIAMVRFKWNVIPVILLSAATGMWLR